MATLSHNGELNHGDPLPEQDEVSRYCSYSRLTHRKCEADNHTQCEPHLRVFSTSTGEPDLSVGWIQYFWTDNRDLALAGIRVEFQAIGYSLSKKGRFVIFNVGQAIQVLKDMGYDIKIKYTPRNWQPSHSSIYELPREGDRKRRRETATTLKRLITRADIYVGIS